MASSNRTNDRSIGIRRFVGQYWARKSWPNNTPSGRVLKLCDEHPTVQFTIAILRQDRESAIRILNSCDGSVWAEWYQVVFVPPFKLKHGLRAQIAANVKRLQLVELLQDRLPVSAPVLTKCLQEAITTVCMQAEAYEQYFLRLLDDLGELAARIVCVKGLSLAWTLYEEPYYRVSVDFDLLIEPGAESLIMSRLVELGFTAPDIDNVRSENFMEGLSQIMLEWPVHAGAVPMGVFLFTKESWPEIDLKVDPLERGLRMNELDRFFSQTLVITRGNRMIRYPSIPDHLMIELINLQKDGFGNLQTLMDIHLLSAELSKSADGWDEFVRLCRIEKVAEVAWAGLDLTRDRLHSPIPDDVLSLLDPNKYSWFARRFMYTCPWFYLWFGGPVHLFRLFINALLTEDKRRKFHVLWAHWFQSWDYLSLRWGQGRHSYSDWRYLYFLFFHCSWRIFVPIQAKLQHVGHHLSRLRELLQRAFVMR